MTWYPCEFPEREPDRETGWHMAACRPCVIACEAWVRSHPEDLLAEDAVRLQSEQMRPGSEFGPTFDTLEWGDSAGDPPMMRFTVADVGAWS